MILLGFKINKITNVDKCKLMKAILSGEVSYIVLKNKTILIIKKGDKNE